MRADEHRVTYDIRWVNGSCVNGRQLGFVYYRAVCSCGQRGGGGGIKSQKSWARRHTRREAFARRGA
jgi:hypothetical protein